MDMLQGTPAAAPPATSTVAAMTTGSAVTVEASPPSGPAGEEAGDPEARAVSSRGSSGPMTAKGIIRAMIFETLMQDAMKMAGMRPRVKASQYRDVICCPDASGSPASRMQ